MLKTYRRAWNRWRSWALPTRIGLALAVVGTLATLLGVSVVNAVPAVSRWLWPLLPQKSREIPGVSVLIKNAGKTDETVPYRGEIFIWLPGEGARHVAGAYEIVAVQGVAVQPGMTTIPAGGATKVLLKIMNAANLYRYLEADDCELTVFFRRSDGSLFDSSELPFTEDALAKYYANADIAAR